MSPNKAPYLRASGSEVPSVNGVHSSKARDSSRIDEPPLSRRHRITWQDPSDVAALVVASMGFSNKAVNHYTGLSNGQIYYRLRKANLQKARAEFRNGTSPIARQMIARNRDFVEGRVHRSLRKVHQTVPPAAPAPK